MYAINRNLDGDASYIWHDSTDLNGIDAVILPGGFSYGDYLRCGAIARFSPVMGAIRKVAAAGGPVLGICNGFQILVEAGLLPGALLRNFALKFVCREVTLRTLATDSPFTSRLKRQQHAQQQQRAQAQPQQHAQPQQRAQAQPQQHAQPQQRAQAQPQRSAPEEKR